ncbi:MULTISPECIES: type VI secretion protein IcmF/TssM N-terminal domain-containing protein [Photorhabdus]|uniref:Membrane protein n=2 Tax=Photorhabdus asymbiotica TaxID=291112 RepID=B6VKY4_PHOAA|nr:type VI secretion protein IcmF/TssM N-terminal domain-containing protein [Photorhabdus asymbiotica]RKS65752.1 type VI secretion system protein ImpL [Photorhabdus asymbiotica]CAQ84361.1 putative membrane protein [Photorhabdus asymbiotica]CAR66814.1 putative membrane protein [Photorhabdus asymbiotica subsp. asymbiotica ATCC 43949]
MKKLFYAIGWLSVMVILLLLSLIIAVAFSWPTIGGLILFLCLLLLLLLLRGAMALIPQITNKVSRINKFWRQGNNRLEYLLYQHWWWGGRLQSWRRFRSWLQRNGSVPPWFLVVGELNSGKQSLLARSNVVPMTGRNLTSFSENTFTCRWWFFRRAMYMVVSGRYTEGQSLYRQAWLRLIRWIAQVRNPAGVLVCLSAEQLLNSDNRALYTMARNVRAQLEPLQIRLERRLPIWLILTHSEALPGFSRWCSQLSVEQRADLLGSFIDQHTDGNVTDVLDKSILTIVDTLKMMRLKLLNQQRQQPQAEVLALPETVAQLKPALDYYLNALFERDHYLEHGLLRGVFFTAEHQTELQQTEGVFSHRLLGEYLPNQIRRSDSVLLTGWRTLTKRALISVFSLMIVYGAGSALVNTWHGVTQLENIHETSPLERSYLRYQYVEQWLQQTVSYLLFYPVTYTLEQRMEQEYQQQVPVDVFNPESIATRLLMRFREAETPQKRLLVLHWSRFINIEQAMARGASLETLQHMPAYSASLLSGKDDPLRPDQRVALRLAQYRQGNAQQAFDQWRDTLQTLLEDSSDWQWLLADEQPTGTHSLTLADFWPLAEGDVAKVNARIRGIYTRAGERDIQATLNELAQALDRPARFSPLQRSFCQQYQNQRQSEWLAFAQAMPQAEGLVRGKKNWQTLVLATGQFGSPYIVFLSRLENDLSTVKQEDQQLWLQTQQRLWQLHGYIQKGSMMQRVSLGNISLRQRIMSWLGISPQISVRLDDNALTRYRDYRQAIQLNSQRELLSDMETESLVKNALSDGKGELNDNGLRTLFNRFALWRHETESKNAGVNETLWRLYQGDAHLVLRYAFLSAASRLQTQWESKVIWPMEKLGGQTLLDGRELNARLYEYSNAFVRDTADYALDIRPEGINRQEIEGVSFPFNDNFMFYINNLIQPNNMLSSTSDIRRRLQEKLALLESERELAAVQQEPEQEQSAEVVITSQPATANRGARVLPVGSSVTLSCNDGEQQLRSMNFNDSMTAHWNPASCGKVRIDVYFPSFTLSKSYVGADSLLQFIRAFSHGELTLTAQTFPQRRNELGALGINDITVRYQIGGEKAVSSLYQQWQQRQQQQTALLEQRNRLDSQLLDLSEPTVAKGSLSTLPLQITTYWNELRKPKSE